MASSVSSMNEDKGEQQPSSPAVELTGSQREPRIKQTAFVEILSATGQDGGSISIEYELRSEQSSIPMLASNADLFALSSTLRGSTEQSSVTTRGILPLLASNAALFALGSTLLLAASYIMPALFEQHLAVILSVLASLVLLVFSAVHLIPRAPTPSVHYFAHPISLVSTRDSAVTLEDGSVLDRPFLLFRVWTRRANGVTLVGYGCLNVPREPGIHEVDVQTWKVVGNGSSTTIHFKLTEFYLGSSPIEFDYMKDMQCLMKTCAEERESVSEDASSNTLITAKAGSIQVRVHVNSGYGPVGVGRSMPFAPLRDRDRGESRTSRASKGNSKPPPTNLREGIDEVLRKVRKHRRERLLRDVYIDGVSPLDKDESATSTGDNEVVEGGNEEPPKSA